MTITISAKNMFMSLLLLLKLILSCTRDTMLIPVIKISCFAAAVDLFCFIRSFDFIWYSIFQVLAIRKMKSMKKVSPAFAVRCLCVRNISFLQKRMEKTKVPLPALEEITTRFRASVIITRVVGSNSTLIFNFIWIILILLHFPFTLLHFADLTFICYTATSIKQMMQCSSSKTGEAEDVAEVFIQNDHLVACNSQYWFGRSHFPSSTILCYVS